MKVFVKKMKEYAIVAVCLLGMTVSAITVFFALVLKVIGLIFNTIGEGIDIAGHWLLDQVRKLGGSDIECKPVQSTAE